MQHPRITLHITRFALAAALGLSAWSAVADPAAGEHPLPPDAAAPGEPLPVHGGGPGPGMGPGIGHGEGPMPGPMMAPMIGPAGEVLETLREIEHLYREQGKSREVVGLYQEVLGKTKDSLVRHFAYEAIARAQQQPTDTDKAIATLRLSLDESLTRLNTMPPPGPHDHDKAP